MVPCTFLLFIVPGLIYGRIVIETSGLCRIDEFTCSYGACVDVGLTCNGVSDCADGSDEDVCSGIMDGGFGQKLSRRKRQTTTSCRSGQWQCQDGVCISFEGKCDGVIDCSDRSDESFTLCGNTTLIRASKCILPPYPLHGTYTVGGDTRALPGDAYATALLNYTCSRGYMLDNDNSMMYCHEGAWYGGFPKCVRACRLDQHESVVYRCLIAGFPGEEGTRDCNPYEPIGTVVRVDCKKPNYYSTVPLTLMRCLEGGWDSYPTCTPECGRLTPKRVELIIGGINGHEDEVPWHVSIYRTSNTPYQQICGGTLVSNTHVISAAHCFWTDTDKKLSASRFAVAVGKLYSPWNHPDDPDAQKSEVSEIRIPPRFQGSAANYQNDIAILILKTPIVYKTNVRPVCLDFSYSFDKRQIQSGKLGTMGGWRSIGNGTRKIQGEQIRIVSIEECLTNVPTDFRAFITSDKFCAGNINGSVFCKGDSGGGLAFPDVQKGIERYYLRGVLSVAPRTDDECTQFAITGFTQLLYHEVFIKDSSACRLDQHESVVYRCLIAGFPGEKGTRDCNPYEPIGTVVRVDCKKPNYYSPVPLTLIRCLEGGWDSYPTCSPECGRLKPKRVELIKGGISVHEDEVPWHVSIYRTSKTPYQQICGGTLVSNTHVISAAHCFWTDTDKKLSASRFAVAVGKLYSPWNHPDDPDAQKSEVSEIRIPPRFQGSAANYQNDIAILILKTPIVYKTNVRPVCLDFSYSFDKRQIQSGKLGTMGGWRSIGNGTRKIQGEQIRIVSIEECLTNVPTDFRAFITSDKICTSNINGSVFCKGDSGGGLAFPGVNKGIERYYLRGVLSVAPRTDDECTQFAITGFTQLFNHEVFIKDSISVPMGVTGTSTCREDQWQCHDGSCIFSKEKCDNFEDCDDGSDESSTECRENVISLSSGNCVLPPYPEYGTYTMQDNTNARPGQRFSTALLNYTCANGYGFLDQTNQILCYNGTWSGSSPTCIRLCRLNQHPSVEYRCRVPELDGYYRQCKPQEPLGTVVHPICRAPLYYYSGVLPTMRCQEDGWDNYPVCLPECGRLTPAGKQLIVGIGGREAIRGEVPWHAGIYRNISNDYSHICGGSIVSTTVVISAAHCFWNDVQKKLPASLFAVAVGKLYRDWNHANDTDAQKLEIKYIVTPSGFRGSATNFQDDIALVILQTPIRYEVFVRPVCLDFDHDLERRQLTVGKMAKVAGWGLTAANGDFAPLLQVVNLPYVDIDKCLDQVPLDFRELVTSDKFCAGYTNGTALCQGDSGGGLAFPESDKGVERYYLRGIVSTAPRNNDKCNQFTITTFTQVTKHVYFIKDYL